jgi:hypothetical protein
LSVHPTTFSNFSIVQNKQIKFLIRQTQTNFFFELLKANIPEECER